MVKFSKSVILNVEKELLINSQLNFRGVNYELNPLFHMTAPNEWKGRLLTEAPVNEKLFSSVILLFGFIPIDLHHLSFKQIFKNGFKESSNSLLMKEWNHNRIIEASEQGTTLTDEVIFSTRIPFLGPIIKPIYILAFRHRHERLKKKFGYDC